ncbi:ZP domain-containing protein-like isoform 2-T2 [Symphorus nematophorus]
MSFLTVLVLLGTGVTVHCVKTNVICSDTQMKVEVDKTSFSGLDENHLRLSVNTNDAVCSLSKHSNRTHIVAVVPLTACGTEMQEDANNIIFKNEITTIENRADLITRKDLLEVQFYCQYPKRGNVTLGFTARRRSFTVVEKGLGTFTYQFLFYETKNFRAVIDPDSYPIQYELGKMMFMQIEATSSVPSTRLFVESCKAAPNNNPNSSPTYSIIEDGCLIDPTVTTYNIAHEKQYRFGMKAFKFIGLHENMESRIALNSIAWHAEAKWSGGLISCTSAAQS